MTHLFIIIIGDDDVLIFYSMLWQEENVVTFIYLLSPNITPTQAMEALLDLDVDSSFINNLKPLP